MKNHKRKRQILYKKQNGICYLCNEKTDEDSATIDHVLPRSKGGSGRMSNLKMACYDCNHKKSDKILTDE